MKNPLISVIVPVYNTDRYLDRCIQSILSQDYPHLELLLIDDGSTDQSAAICDKWAEKDKRIRVFHQNNGGQSSARNLGLDNMTGDYLSFVDSDDWIAPDYLSYLFSLLGFKKGCAVAACNHFIVRNGKMHPNTADTSSTRSFTRRDALEEVLYHGCIDVSPWGKLYKKEIFVSLRFPTGRIFEDTWLSGDLLMKADSVIFGGRCCYFYECRDQSTVNQSFSPRNLQYIEAAEKLASDASKIDDDLRLAGIRRINHARLSVLRYMEKCEGEFVELREELRKSIIADAPLYIHLPRTPRRDRIAVFLLKISLPAFYSGWRLYTKYRK